MNSNDDNVNNSEPEETEDHSFSNEQPEDAPEDQTSDDSLPKENPEEYSAEEASSEPEKDEHQEAEIHKNIFRSRSDRIFLGVCSGLGIYFDTEPLFFRLAFILSLIFGFWGIVFYLILGIIIPEEPKTSIPDEEQTRLNNENHKVLIGSSLVLLGIFLIVKNTRLFHFFQVWRVFAQHLIPAALIISGIYLLFRRNASVLPHQGKLYRSGTHKKVGGVCAGLAEYLNVDPTIIRILWLLFIFSSFGVGLLIYLVFVIMVPEKQANINENQSEYN